MAITVPGVKKNNITNVELNIPGMTNQEKEVITGIKPQEDPILKSIPKMDDFANNQEIKSHNNILDTIPMLKPQLSDVYDSVLNTDPQRTAKVIRLAQQLDQPELFIDKNLTEAEKVSNAPDFNYWNDFQKNAPKTASFLSDPKNMATAKDLLPELEEQEQHFDAAAKYKNTTIGPYTPSIFERIVGLNNAQKISNIASAPFTGLYSGLLNTAAGIANLGQLEYGLVEKHSPVGKNIFGAVKKGFTGIRDLLEKPANKQEEIVSKQPFNEIGQSLFGAAEIVPMMGAAAAGQLVGIPAPVSFGAMSAGQYAREAELGGATPEQQAAYGAIMGTVEALTEKIPLEGFTKIFGKSARTALISYLKTIPEEYVQESASQIASILAKQMIYDPEKLLTDGNLDWSKVTAGVSETLQAGAQGAQGAAILGGIGFAGRGINIAGRKVSRLLSSRDMTIAESKIKIKDSKTNKEIYQKTGDLVSKSQYLDRLPESWRVLAESNLKDGQLENIYIDSEPFITLLQSMTPEGVDSGEVINKVGEELGIFNQLKEAIDTGKSISIPYATWLEKTTKSPIYKKLEGDIKFSEDGITLNQATMEEEQVKTAIEKEQKNVNIESDNYDTIYNDIHDQLIMAGRNEKEAKYSAQVFTSRMIAEGARRKVNPIELYMGMMKPEIKTGENVVQEGVLNQAANDQGMENSKEFKKWFEGSKVADEKGEPLKVYHGTANLFDEFSTDYVSKSLGHPNDVNYQKGFFFTTDTDEAKYVSTEAPGNNPRIVEAYVSIKNPFEVKIKNNESIGGFNKTSDPSVYYDNMADEIMIAADEAGADGIIVRNTDTGKQTIIPFNPDQIKIIPEESGSKKKSGLNENLGQSQGFSIEELKAKFKTVSPEEFVVQRNKSSKLPFLTPYTAEDMKDWNLYLTDDGIGFALNPNKDMIGVFNNSDIKGAGEKAVTCAIIEGAKTCDCIEGFLDKYYNNFGFIESNRVEWNDEFAPKGWDYEQYGRNDVVYFYFPDELSREPADVAARLRFAKSERVAGRDELFGISDFNENINQEKQRRLDQAEQSPTSEGIGGTSRTLKQSTNENLGENQGSSLFQNVRGFLTFRYDENGNPISPLLGLLESADASTFLHESAHLFLEDTFQFVKAGQADENYMKDWNTLSEHLGINTEQEKLTVDQQEQFAREFEAYLMEGKAPSEKLRNAFSAFRRWLTRIYRSIAGLNVQLSDPVREVMDRMLATDDEIRAQEMQNGYLDDIVKESDVSPAVWNKLQDLKNKAHETAIETLMNSQMQELSIEHQEMLEKERKKAQETIEKEVAELPIYKTIEAVKLAFKFEKSVFDLTDRYNKGEELANGGNLKFDALAESFGYSSGDEMAKDIYHTPDFKTEVQKRVDNYIAANYDDLKNTAAITAAAKNAIHNDAQLEVMALEKTILTNLINKEQQKQTTKKYNLELAKVAKDSAKKYASTILNSKPYREATATVSYFAAEKNAAVKEGKALEKNNYRDAAMYAEQKLLNHALAIESIKIKTRVQKMEDYLKKAQRKKMEAFKTEVHFVQIASILDRFGFSRSDYDPTTKQETLSAWIEKMDQLTNMVDIPDWIQNESIVKQYKELTIDELQDVVDTIKNIQHVANMENKTLVAWGKIDIREIASKLRETADKNIKKKQEVKLGSYRSKIEKIAEGIDSAKFTILNVETILRELDGFESMGPWWKTFYEMFDNASNDETSRMIKAIDEYRKILSVYSEKERDKMANQKIYLPEINASLIKNDIMSIALNWGNAANKERLLGGREWDEATTKSMLEKNLDKRDWEFVQNVWNFLNGFWPDASKLHEELTGFKPSKVDSESFEVTLPDGSIHQMKGGYYPLKRDYNVDIRAARERNADNPLNKETPTWRAMTKKNHLKNRSVHAQYPVLLDINLIQRHVTDVIHDIAFRKAVIDANRMLRADGEISKIVQENIGMNGFETLENWVKAAAGDRPQPTLKAWDRMFSWIRRHTVIFALGGRIGTMFQNMVNFTSAVNAMEGFGWGNVAHAALSNGIMDYYGKSIFNPKHAAEIDSYIMDKSPFMHERSTTFDRDIKEMTSRMFSNDNKLQRFSMAGYSYFDKLVNVPLWLEAYRLEINKSGDEELAIQYADSLVRKTSGSGRTIDMPEIMRSNEIMKLFTMFYSFMNSQLNLSYEAMSQFKKEGDIPKFLGRTMALWILPSTIGTLMAFKSPGDDDDKTSWWLKQILTYPTQMIPVIRDMVNVVMDAALGMKSFGYKPTAASGIVEAFQGLAGSLRGLAEGEKELPEVVESGTKVAGYVTPYPNMFNNWFWNAFDYMNGMEPEANDILKRRPKKER